MQQFTHKVRAEKRNDQELFNASFAKILSVVTDTKQKFFKASSFSNSVKSSMNDVVRFLGYPVVDIPAEIDDAEEQIEYVLNRTGVMRRKITLRGKWWMEINEPLLCTIEENGMTVMVKPLNFGGYEFINPKTHAVEKISDKNCSIFSSSAYCFYRAFPHRKMGYRDLLGFIFTLVSRAEMVYTLLVSVLAVLMGLVLPFLSRTIFDRIIPSGTINDIWPITALLLGTSMSAAAFILLKTLCLARMNDKIKLTVQSATWARMLHLPAEFFKRYSSGEILERIQAMNQICDILSGSAISIILSTIISFAYLYQIRMFSDKLVLPSLMIILMMIGFAVIISILEVRHQRRISEISARLSGLVFQLFSGVAKIKIAAAEVRAFSKWAEHYNERAEKAYSPNILLTGSNAIFAVFGIGSNILIYIVVMKNNISPADFIAFNVAFGAFTYVVMQFYSIVKQIAALKSSFELVKPLLEEVPETKAASTKVTRLYGKIDVSSVSFRYTKDGPLILDEISLSIQPGEYVALVGTTGCGKSTLLRILLGFEKPQSGAVYFDDQDLDKLDVRSVRQRIGVVIQNGTLFADDIYSNITICAPWLTVDQAWEAAEKAGVADDIRNMPMGMFTMISEGGEGISGGQKQRLMIARAFAANPDIIMFDEATSALDNITQSIVVNSLERMEATRIVIAHRLSTIQKCDRIIVLHKGQVVEEGSYDSLMKKNGHFAEMAKRQIL